jgi:hypothetical protein
LERTKNTVRNEAPDILMPPLSSPPQPVGLS